jgi:hypothetical protein
LAVLAGDLGDLGLAGGEGGGQGAEQDTADDSDADGRAHNGHQVVTEGTDAIAGLATGAPRGRHRPRH